MVVWLAHCIPALTIAAICAYWAITLNKPAWLFGIGASTLLLPTGSFKD